MAHFRGVPALVGAAGFDETIELISWAVALTELLSPRGAAPAEEGGRHAIASFFEAAPEALELPEPSDTHTRQLNGSAPPRIGISGGHGRRNASVDDTNIGVQEASVVSLFDQDGV